MIEPAELPHNHHHRTGIPWFDLFVPLAVVCVSIASLLTSLHSERSMEALVEQNRRLVEAQSTPLLTYDTGNYSDNGKFVISMRLSNFGTGPAQIFWFRASDEQGTDFTGGALTERVMRLDPKSKPISQQVTTMIRSGDERLIFRWPRPTNPTAIAEWEKLNHTRFHLHLSACYCSIFDECRITDFGSSRPKPVQSCEQEPKQGKG